MNNYFYIDSENKQCGPFSVTDLQKQNISAETLVWCSGMSDWLPARLVDELKSIFDGGQQQTTASASSANSTTQTQTQYNNTNTNGGYQNTHPNQGYTGQGYNSRPYNNGQQQYNQQGNFQGSLSSSLPLPKTWFVESLLATIFCCLPFGVVGLISANKVESLYYAGDYEGSLKASKDAGKWTKVAFFVAIAGWVLYILFYVIIIGAAFSTSLWNL